jgi:uncharacterized damage-inducible protein DinB
MNKKYFIELAGYNNWADSKAIGWLEQIDENQWKREIASSFSSIEKTAVHIASAQKIWIDFWSNAPNPVYLSAGFNGTKSDLIEIWKCSSSGMKTFIENSPEEDYQHEVTFIYPRGGQGSLELYQSFAHIMNHSTYHRGQLVTLLRHCGFTTLSSTDLATYYRMTNTR